MNLEDIKLDLTVAISKRRGYQKQVQRKVNRQARIDRLKRRLLVVPLKYIRKLRE